MMTLITVAIVIAAAAFAIWILYSVIWRAVRRGLQEYELARVAHPASALAMPLSHRVSFLHRAAIEVVPDYPPRDWV